MEGVIDRCEQKYFLSNEQYSKFINETFNYLEKDKYFKETIYNIYFDNDNYELINNSLDKPDYKEKVRLRSYEMVNEKSLVFLEIKKKYHSHTNKRRITITYQEYLNYIEKGIIPSYNHQIIKEIDYCFKKYMLKPKVKVKYDRLSFYLKEDKLFRITFDNNVCYDLDDLDFKTFDSKKKLFNNGYIMEIKTFKGIPSWLNEIFGKLKIYPVSYSKIGKICEMEGNKNV